MSARPAARDGDLHACPEEEPGPTPHVGGPVGGGSPNVYINRRPAARAGEGTTCVGPRGTVTEGSRGVFINNQSAARLGDPTGHGGRVVQGSENVFIGHNGKQGQGQTPTGQSAGAQQAVVLHADYDRNGTLEASTAEHGRRLARPGAILLANLDIDLARAPDGNRVPRLDGYQATLRPDDDDPLAGRLTSSPYGPVTATQVSLEVHPADARRIRVFRQGAARALLGTQSALSGPGGAASAVHRVRVPNALPIDLSIQALTLPGDPRWPGPTSGTPAPPDAVFAGARPSDSSAAALYRQRAPADVFFTVVHEGAGATVRDVSLFTIAPFLLIPNTEPAEKLFVAVSGTHNHNMVYDLSEACRSIWSAAEVDLPATPSQAFRPHTPETGASRRVYLVRSDDIWVQDQMDIGYCDAPHGWMHVVLHCPRRSYSGHLSRFVRNELAASGLGVYDGVHTNRAVGQDFGGNIEVSPPIAEATDPMPRGLAGPSVPGHPPAPFGKIIVGDCTRVTTSGPNRGRRPHGHMQEPLRRFLLAQKVQPVLPVDTSWLSVGHVDEFMITLPDRRGGGFKLLFASAALMRELFRLAAAVAAPARTGLHVGKYEDDHRYAELAIEDLDVPLDTHPADRLMRVHDNRLGTRPQLASTGISVREYNASLERLVLRPVRERLMQGLKRDPADVIPLPLYFKVPSTSTRRDVRERTYFSKTAALTVASVNMQVVNDHLLVPRPFSVRVPRDDADRILRDVLPSVGLGHLSPVLAPSGSFRCWFPPREKVWKICAYFADLTAADRTALTTALRARPATLAQVRSAVSPAGVLAIEATRARLSESPGSDPIPGPATGLSDGARLRSWTRIHVTETENRVDLVEAYLRTVLEPLGLTIHFIDDWRYHVWNGNTHCGTMVLRTPPRSGPRWWDHYDPSVDLDYDPTQ